MDIRIYTLDQYNKYCNATTVLLLIQVTGLSFITRMKLNRFAYTTIIITYGIISFMFHR